MRKKENVNVRIEEKDKIILEKILKENNTNISEFLRFEIKRAIKEFRPNLYIK